MLFPQSKRMISLLIQSDFCRKYVKILTSHCAYYGNWNACISHKKILKVYIYIGKIRYLVNLILSVDINIIIFFIIKKLWGCVHWHQVTFSTRYIDVLNLCVFSDKWFVCTLYKKLCIYILKKYYILLVWFKQWISIFCFS